jgi:malonate-semialdehyde dehydrogenase (acetylating) / methylmalonate-semialdehyde dehydrogenase
MATSTTTALALIKHFINGAETAGECTRTQPVDALINANPYGNGTAIFTCSGANARKFQRSVTVGMIGMNVPLPVPVAYHSFGGWKASLFGDKHIYGPEGVSFYTRGKVVTSHWPEPTHASGGSPNFPSN